MGLFDSFIIKARCPYCEEEREMEFQTTDFDCDLIEWKQGEPFKSKYIEIITGVVKNCVAGCNSKKCDAYQEKRDGYKSEFGRLFYADIQIKDGIVDKAINIRKLGKKNEMKELDRVGYYTNNQPSERWKKLLRKLGVKEWGKL